MILKIVLPSTWLVSAALLSLALPPSAAAEAPARAALGAGFDRVVESHAGGARAQAPDPHGVLRLRDAIGAMLLGNPGLAVFSWEVRSREARAVQADLLPNPELTAEVENLGGSGERDSFEQAETTVWLAQLVQIGGKRAKRSRLAALEHDLSGWDYEGARLGALTATTRAFVKTLSAQRRLELVHELERLATESIRSIHEQVQAGAAPAVEEMQARVELARALLQRQAVERELAVSRVTLASMWGRGVPRFTAVIGDLAQMTPVPLLADLERRIKENPDVARWRTEVDRHEASLSLERARGLPNPTFSLGGRHFNDNGDTALVVALSVPIPVFDRNQGNVLAATYDVERARAARLAAELAVRTAVRERHAELVAAFAAAEMLREDALPAARAALEGTRDGHRKGLFHYREVLDAQRMLFELRTQRIEALSGYHLARADLERLTATPLDAAALAGSMP
jgi:cobalt-zinc-cadmium efflux system outer membrane protein